MIRSRHGREARRFGTRTIPRAVAVALFSTVTWGAHADEAVAKKLFEDGAKAFARGDFVVAAKAFETANREAPSRAALHNAGLAWQASFDAPGGDAVTVEAKSVDGRHLGATAAPNATQAAVTFGAPPAAAARAASPLVANPTGRRSSVADRASRVRAHSVSESGRPLMISRTVTDASVAWRGPFRAVRADV